AFLLHRDKLAKFSRFFINHLLEKFNICFASEKFIIFSPKKHIHDIELPSIPIECRGYIDIFKQNIKTREAQHEKLSTPLFFLHIPKTAGSALRSVLDDLSNNSIYLSNESKICDIKTYLDNNTLSPYDIVAGHLSFDIYEKYYDFFEKRRIITILRDPIERMFSLLAHSRRPIKDPIRFATADHMQAMRRFSLQYLVEESDYAEQLLLGQLDMLGSDDRIAGKVMAYPNIAYDKAIERIEKYNILVGITEQLDWFVYCLSNYVGKPLLELPQRNITTNRYQYISAEEKDYAETVLRPKLAFEYKLYDYCLKQSYKQYQSLIKP
uniref:hypothetical protein n=1 Tax=Candidatus Albibeggiatoa sp. nov. BB20 TaxID=3162723 RepID=UPI00336598EA